MVLPTAFFIVAILLGTIDTRVIEITSNNIHLVLRSVSSITLLLSNPNCEYSKAYVDDYLRIKTPDNLGLADCVKDKVLCDYLNVTHYPTVLRVSNQLIQKVDEYQFLLNASVIGADDSRVVLRQILKLLKDEKKWAAVVLEEERLPTLDKVVDNVEKRVMYVRNPSKLHQVLSSMVGKQLGCWILVNEGSYFSRYYCGNGYRSDELEKHLSLFLGGKLQKHLFSKESESTYIQHAELKQMIADLGYKSSSCKLIYFFSKACQHCSLNDVQKANRVLKQVQKQKKYSVRIFDMDTEEMPKGLALRRLPELVEFCEGRVRFFGDVFQLSKLKRFLSNEGSMFEGVPPGEKLQSGQMSQPQL